MWGRPDVRGGSDDGVTLPKRKRSTHCRTPFYQSTWHMLCLTHCTLPVLHRIQHVDRCFTSPEAISRQLKMIMLQSLFRAITLQPSASESQPAKTMSDLGPNPLMKLLPVSFWSPKMQQRQRAMLNAYIAGASSFWTSFFSSLVTSNCPLPIPSNGPCRFQMGGT